MSLIQWRSQNCNPLTRAVNEDVFFTPFLPIMEKALVNSSSQWFAALDIQEDKDKYTIEADLPGMSKEQINVAFEEGVLTIEGERKAEHEKREGEYHRIERSYGRFVRNLNLGHAVDAEAINATYRDGVLTVTVPKKEAAKPKSISINS